MEKVKFVNMDLMEIGLIIAIILAIIILIISFI